MTHEGGSEGAQRPRVHVLALGGTIAMTGELGPGVTPRLTAEDLLAATPGLDAVADVQAEQLRQLPSAALTRADLLATARRIIEVLDAGADAVVVTQGTDTIEETAFALDLVLPGPQPVVVTGAMRPANVAGADGPASLLAAVQVAASPAARGAGVLVVFDEQIHAASRVRKGRASSPGAFTSPDTGPLGWVVEGEVHVLAVPSRRRTVPDVDAALLERIRVGVLPVQLDDDGLLLDAVVGLDRDGRGFDALVVEAFGGGNVPPSLVGDLASLATRIPVVLTTRTGAGMVHTATYGYPGGGVDLVRAGLIPGGWLDARKARLLLTLLLAAGVGRDELAEWFV
ncbi:MAG: asparaginase [Actinomycetales bacterium]|nr:asparaginase [Actinomycetales bacterium]